MTDITSIRGKEMIRYLPRYYETSRVMKSILQVEGMEFDDLKAALDETLDQFFVRSATWGLDQWEKELGLAPAQDQPNSERRDRIISRLRGTGTATIRIVKEVAESYDNGAINVIEDHAIYTVIIRFVDTAGVPPNLNDLKAAVRAVLPAHLDIVYEFAYLFIADVEAMTIAELEAVTLDQFAGGA